MWVLLKCIAECKICLTRSIWHVDQYSDAEIFFEIEDSVHLIRSWVIVSTTSSTKIAATSEYGSAWNILRAKCRLHSIMDFTSTHTVKKLYERWCKRCILGCLHAIVRTSGGISRYRMHSQHSVPSIGACTVIFLFKWRRFYRDATFIWWPLCIKQLQI